MGKILAKLLVTAFSLILISYIIPGISVSNFTIALLAAFVFGILNVLLKPLLVLLTLPINLLTLGLFTLVINGFLFWFVARFIDGFEVDGFFAAFIGAVVMSGFSYIYARLVE